MRASEILKRVPSETRIRAAIGRCLREVAVLRQLLKVARKRDELSPREGDNEK
ncbi:hypothetical protein Mal4_19750 [Maioricimonas rarisocia]|uniref:Uncharacterized protein n=1 Tax=Maioricimonas rarisocia TaxID=2528026 RepID=A0A517Z592_9PLAN|nr:hypothetical protein Mal4_19750 [Maioricimonas rarisocia]